MDGNNGTSHTGKFDKSDVSKKRKNVNEIDGTGRYSKETSETNHKEKKARLVKSFDEGMSASQFKTTEDAKLLDRSRRDKAVTATSSSSKVSGSHKTMTNNHETKGSPVESVSSSPMRILNPNKFQSPRRNSSSVERWTKNVDTRPCDDISRGGRHKSKELALNRNVRITAVSSQDSKKPSKKDAYVKEKSNSLPPRGQNEIEWKENSMPLKASKPNTKDQNVNGNQPMISKDPSPNKHKGKIQDSVGVVLVRELSNQATTNALREATHLKHMADRVKVILLVFHAMVAICAGWVMGQNG